ncbi:probable trehalose-phosphate phosphatase G [Nymphaea colorata]|nr:probable trehalose-phosphate phosphatase G [Nymphaea colorata]XP_031481464.1 probable trehalose-phosphate phosphatase G [Nymphaea colorata]
MAMDVKSNQPSPVLTDPAPLTKPRLGLSCNLVPCSTTASYTSGIPSGHYLGISRKKHWQNNIENVYPNGWLDAMKASSPTHRNHATKDESSEQDAAFRLWEVAYPSALGSFKLITNSARGKRILLFLDYDGTLSPIVDNPDFAFILDGMRPVIHEAAKLFATAIISGRRRDQVYKFVGLSELYYAGSHGMDITVPVNDSSNVCCGKVDQASRGGQGNELNFFQPANEFLSMIDEVFNSLVESTKGIDGIKVENNKFCVSVHYRCVKEEKWDAVSQQVQIVLQRYPRLRLTHGRKVMEVRPKIKWDKGKAVEFFIETLGPANCHDVFPIYIGDDRTDEDAFKVLKERHEGIGILVSEVPKETSASYTLKDPSEVKSFLECLIKWRKSENLGI